MSPTFEFDRYVNGRLMAEGVTIERQPTLERAMEAAAKIASRGPRGEKPVLVYRPDFDRVKQLEEALRPFAEAAREFTFSIGPDGIDDHLTIVARSVARDREAYLSTADFHRAAALLNGGSNA